MHCITHIPQIDVASGFISTAAGNGATVSYTGPGPASSTDLNTPWGLAFDADGNLYISDHGNSDIMKVAL